MWIISLNHAWQGASCQSVAIGFSIAKPVCGSLCFGNPYVIGSPKTVPKMYKKLLIVIKTTTGFSESVTLANSSSAIWSLVHITVWTRVARRICGKRRVLSRLESCTRRKPRYISHILLPARRLFVPQSIYSQKNNKCYMHIKYDLPNVLVTYCNYRSAKINTVGYSLIIPLLFRLCLSFQMVTHLAHLTGAPANGMDLPIQYKIRSFLQS